MWSTLLFGLGVGLVLGLTGAGGGVLAVPALVFSQDWTVAQAAPVGLLAVTGAAALGTAEGFMRRQVRYRAALLMALTGIPLAPVGVAMARQAPASLLFGLFALTLLVVAVRLLHPSLAGEREDAPAKIDPQTGRLHWTPGVALLLGSVGAVTGFLTGLLGVGGGFVLVPALRRLTNIGMHGLVATSLMVITLVGCATIVTAVWHGTAFPLTIALPFIAATAGGMVTGRLLVQHFHPRHVQQVFAMLVIGVAVLMAYRAIS
jgi:uncharacterized membrane protein YfcA